MNCVQYVPAYISQVLKNQYSEPAATSPLLFYFHSLCINNDKEYHAFQENESHGCLNLYNGYW